LKSAVDSSDHPALIQYSHQPAHAFTWNWFSPLNFSTYLLPRISLTILLLGWDARLTSMKKTRDSTSAPGRGAVAAMIIVIIVYEFSELFVLVLSDAEIEKAGTNVLFARRKTFPHPWDYMAVMA